MKNDKNISNRRTRVLLRKDLDKITKEAKACGCRVRWRRKSRQVEIMIGGRMVLRAVCNGDAFWPCAYDREAFEIH